MRRIVLRAGARMLGVIGVAIVTASLVALPALPAHADEDASGDIGISVPVLGTDPPSPGATSGNGSPGRGAAAASGSETAVATNAPGPEPAATDLLIAGGLYLSDVNGSSRPTVNPFEGRAELWVTLRNLSNDTIDAAADFSIATFSGALIADDRILVTDLKPGETRAVGTSLPGTGQWPFVIGRVTIDPPDEIAGQQTAPVSRATVIYGWPWLAVIGLVLVALAVILLRLTARVVTPSVPVTAGVS